ncbi:uncharacterized protein TM35_000025020 [Trypanosoma theileri]|uniref:Uncharacterized protein n=1 Tax=Trypanosoma theileri TaxID=67003 RepID=A0A1X0P8A6_9TRYP|nr:uncharacterized protein TM35_000025020 [Trypanosoma theileri]ORC93176.1 hypothetical protein TM35_000025020 [Trypanosoma theileri]
MSTDETDGSLSDVNPELLELSKDPVAWREQRRRALQEKVFGRSGTASGSSPAELSSGGECKRATAEQEAYVLQQIMSHKRRRDAAAAEEETKTTNVEKSAKMSMKEKLLQQLKKAD